MTCGRLAPLNNRPTSSQLKMLGLKIHLTNYDLEECRDFLEEKKQ